MGHTVHIASAVLAVLLSAGVEAQTGTDFSGRWVRLEASGNGADLPESLDVEQPVVRTTARGTPMEPAFLRITVRRHFADASSVETYRIGVDGGTVAGSDHRPVASTSLSIRWDELRLVIERSSYGETSNGGGQPAETREIWELDSEDQLRITRTVRSAGSETATTRAAYRRE